MKTVLIRRAFTSTDNVIETYVVGLSGICLNLIFMFLVIKCFFIGKMFISGVYK